MKYLNELELLKKDITELQKCYYQVLKRNVELFEKLTKLEEEKTKVTDNITNLTEQLSTIEETLVKNISAKNKYAQTIQETEAAYMKILESSQTLLHVLKREQTKIGKKH